jgi:hypothetical protein
MTEHADTHLELNGRPLDKLRGLLNDPLFVKSGWVIVATDRTERIARDVAYCWRRCAASPGSRNSMRMTLGRLDKISVNSATWRSGMGPTTGAI